MILIVLIPLTWPFLVGLTLDVVPDRVSLFELVLQTAGIGALAGIASRGRPASQPVHGTAMWR